MNVSGTVAAAVRSGLGSGFARASTVCRSETSTRPLSSTSPAVLPALQPYCVLKRSWRVTIPL